MKHASHRAHGVPPRIALDLYHQRLLDMHGVCDRKGLVFSEEMGLLIDGWLRTHGNEHNHKPDTEQRTAEARAGRPAPAA